MRPEDIAPEEADAARERVAAALDARGERTKPEVVELGALTVCAYPALLPSLEAHPEDLAFLARGTERARDVRAYRRLAATAVGDPADAVRVERGLRRLASREKLRIATRELLAYPGQDVDVTSRELSDLADVCCEVALAEALAWADGRFGTPTTATGARCPVVVVGMGKLGGRELNAGSDVDLILFYETDEGSVGEEPSRTLHEYFTRVAQRFVGTLDRSTEEGIVWRVDLRLRPEGTRGALVNALPAAERYYETWGRTWERAALVRSRVVAGDAAFGDRLLETLAPFVWRRAVDPHVVDEMAAMLARSRAEGDGVAERDLKIGPGGIREVEFFAQSLQLVWGGREPLVRVTNTIDALRRLRGRGLVTEREEADLADAYLLLRRVEHRVQFATGQQTHALPTGPMLDRIGRSLGYASGESLARELGAVRAGVSRRFSALRRAGGEGKELPGTITPMDGVLGPLWAALDVQDEQAVAAVSARRFGALVGTDLPRHLIALARRPDDPLGAATRDREPALGPRLIEALADAADPEQAARLLVAFFSRFATPGVYVRALAEDPRLVRALCSLLGASAFLGETLAAHPDLVDRVLFVRGSTDAAAARAQLDEEASAAAPGDLDGFVGALRRAKRRVTFEVGLADLAGELGPREVSLALTALADATLQQTCRFAMRERSTTRTSQGGESGEPEEVRGLALVAMGKLGGREIGYGSDLDLIFVYDGEDPVSAEHFARTAQRVLRLAGASHDEGPGYELDTRLRPSGSQGLLVVSLEGFARYQEERAQDWERQALIKARACAGDMRLGERVVAIARHAAYERGAPDPENLRRLRERMERELGHERLDRAPFRYDLKVGRGGIVDIEFAVQWLQMRHGGDPRVRTTETEAALGALEGGGYLDRPLAESLRDGWRFLRRLEQRLRIAHGTSASLIEEGAPGLSSLARRMGMRDGPRASAEHALLARYVGVTSEVRAAYTTVLGSAPVHDRV